MKTVPFIHHGAFAAALTLLLAPERASAGLVYDLRVTGGGKMATVSSLGQVVSLDLFAQVTGSDGRPEGFQDGYGSVLSSDLMNQNIMGSLSSSLVSTYQASSYQPGRSQNLDTDGDFDLGSNQTMPNTDFFYARAASLQTSGAAIPGGTEFKLATFFFTVQSVGDFFNPNPITVNFAVPTFSGQLNIEALWQQDGTATNSNGLGGGTLPTVGPNVMISAIPEPSSLGLLGLAGVALASRRRTRR